MFASRKKNIRGRNSGRAPSSFQAHLVRGLLVIICTALVFTAVYYVTRLNVFTVQQVIVEGGETIPHEEIESRAEALLSGSYLGLIPKRFIYAYPHEMIRDAVLGVPRVRVATLQRTDTRDLRITFEEHSPHALWCFMDRVETPCYFLNSEGYAFAEAPLLHGGAFVRHYTEAYAELEKKQVLDSEKLADIDWFSEQLERESGFRIVSVFWKSNRDVELSVSGGGMFIIASGKDIHVTYENLLAVLTSDTYDHIAPGNFKYIDVRFDKKIFVNEELIDASAATTTTEAMEIE